MKSYKSHSVCFRAKGQVFAFIEANRKAFPLAVICGLMQVSRFGFYAWRARPASARSRLDAELTELNHKAHQLGRQIYGSPRVVE